MFADRYPDEVVGIVLVDASHPDQWVNIPSARQGRTVALGNRVTGLLARLGVLRLFRAQRPYIAGLPPASMPRCARTWLDRKGGKPEPGDCSRGPGARAIR